MPVVWGASWRNFRELFVAYPWSRLTDDKAVASGFDDLD